MLDLERHFKPQSVQSVYDQILTDVEEAKKRLQISTPKTLGNFRFSRLGLYALEARVNLYMNRRESALKAADKALSLKNTLLDLNENPQVLPTEEDGLESILALERIFETEAQDAAYASQSLIDLYDQKNDLRFSLHVMRWNYESGAEDKAIISALGVNELYLNKSEALLHLGRISESKTVLSTLIRYRYRAASINRKIKAIEAMDRAAYTRELFAER